MNKTAMTGRKQHPATPLWSMCLDPGTVVSPHPVLRMGLRELLGDVPDIDIQNDVADIEDAYLLDIDVVVLAAVSPADLTDKAATADLHALLLLTDDVLDVQRLTALELSTWEALTRHTTEGALYATVRALSAGLWVSTMDFATALWRQPNRPQLDGDQELAKPLTDRELEVVQLLAPGLAIKQIVLALHISRHTV